MPVIRDTMCVRGGTISYATWFPDRTRFLVLLAHGYAEHSGRYWQVARRLAAEGAVVCAPDHVGHGHSDGTPGLVRDVEPLVDDLAALHESLRGQYAGIPVVLFGHAMGGLIAIRYAQRGVKLEAMVLAGPIIGGPPQIAAVLALPDLPSDPHDPRRQTLDALVRAANRAMAGPSLDELPTLWIHAEVDRLASSARLRAALKRVRGLRLEERVYPAAQTDGPGELNSDGVLDDVVEFLRRTLSLTRPT